MTSEKVETSYTFELLWNILNCFWEKIPISTAHMDSARPIISIKNKKSFWVSIFGSGLDGCNHQMTYRKSSIKPPWGTYLFQTHFSGGLIETGAYLRGGGGLFNLAKTMVSVLHKEREYKVEKLKSITNLNCQLVNKPSRISPHEVLQSWLIQWIEEE